MELEDNAVALCELLNSDRPCLIGRNGSLELTTLLFFITKRSKDIEYPYNLLNKLTLHAGIFPCTTVSVDAWCKSYIQGLKACDALAEGWYTPLANDEIELHKSLNRAAKRILLRNLEPYYVAPPLRWSNYLNNKKVAIINSFAETCVQQTYVAAALWGTEYESLLPTSTQWIPIRTYYSPALSEGVCGWPKSIDCWEEAVAHCVVKTVDSGATVAIVGCGGLGMIIGAELKKRGLQVIILGGATQILFGIKGERWIYHSTISRFFNDMWVSPSEDCIPKGYAKIENGCYWYKDKS